jgi:hypothetical protein
MRSADRRLAVRSLRSRTRSMSADGSGRRASSMSSPRRYSCSDRPLARAREASSSRVSGASRPAAQGRDALCGRSAISSSNWRSAAAFGVGQRSALRLPLGGCRQTILDSAVRRRSASHHRRPGRCTQRDPTWRSRSLLGPLLIGVDGPPRRATRTALQKVATGAALPPRQQDLTRALSLVRDLHLRRSARR